MKVSVQPTLSVLYKSVHRVYEDAVYTRHILMLCFTWLSIVKLVQFVYSAQRILKIPVHPATKHKTL